MWAEGDCFSSKIFVQDDPFSQSIAEKFLSQCKVGSVFWRTKVKTEQRGNVELLWENHGVLSPPDSVTHVGVVPTCV